MTSLTPKSLTFEELAYYITRVYEDKLFDKRAKFDLSRLDKGKDTLYDLDHIEHNGLTIVKVTNLSNFSSNVFFHINLDVSALFKVKRPKLDKDIMEELSRQHNID